MVVSKKSPSHPDKLEELGKEDGEAESPLLCFLALGLDANECPVQGKLVTRLPPEVAQPDSRTDGPVTHSAQRQAYPKDHSQYLKLGTAPDTQLLCCLGFLG